MDVVHIDTMKIVLDGRCISRQAHGISRYAENLVKYMPLEVDDELWVLYHPDRIQPWEQSGVTWVACPISECTVQEQIRLPLILRQIKPDIYHTPSYVLPWHVPCPVVMTLHDLIHIHPDEKYPFKHRLYYQYYLKRRLKKVKHVLTVSESSKIEIQNWIDPMPLPITVIYPGVESHFMPIDTWILTLKKYPVSLPYILYVGNHRAHKNFKLLKSAFGMFRERHGAICNLLAVGVTAEGKEEEGIFYLPSVPESDLPAIYSGARMLVCPSLREGFGLPVLEAMACGLPVVVSQIPSLLEIIGKDSAGLTFDPDSEMSLIEAMTLLLADGKVSRELGKRGRLQAAYFLWQETALRTMQVYRNVAGT